MTPTRRFQQHLARLRQGPRPTPISRPCTLGSGVEACPDQVAPLPPEIAARLSFFVPASGAATRLFGPLLQVDPKRAPTLDTLRRAAQDHPSVLGPALAAIEGWSQLAISREQGIAPPSSDLATWLRALRDSRWPGSPKALVPFHLVKERPTSPMFSHLSEAAALTATSPGSTAVHFTAGQPHIAATQQEGQRCIRELGAQERLDLHVSTQDPSTDTPAVELDGLPVRIGDRYLSRPGGHGALIGNLPAADLLLIRNIDNAPHPDHLAVLLPSRQGLIRALIDLEEEHHALVRAARSGQSLAQARTFLERFGLTGPVEAQAILHDLHRPIRVCGVVPNRGQPGGGPFWVKGPDGRTTPQIVETAEIDRDDPDQQSVHRAATHFNPVDLVCSLRDVDGEPYPLDRYIDSERWIITTRVHEGRPIRCLEHPGLWNGSMSGWLTLFVELPPETFNPVKTLADLLHPRHQAAT